MKKNIVLFLFVFSFLQAQVNEYYKPICVITTSRNNADWYKRNLDSVFAQNYPQDKIHLIYCDDASMDNTYDLVWDYVVQCGWQKKVTLLGSDRRRGALFNHWRAIHLCSPETIVVNLDGDDWFSHDNVLQVINEKYKDPNVWMTFGQYEEYHQKGRKIGHCRDIPQVVKQRNAYRTFDWVSSHLRTFYAGLFHQIPLGYLLYKDDFFTSAVDLAMMFAMLELSDGRVQFISDVLYMYNCMNQNNTFRKNVLWQLTMGYVSRGRQPLQPLSFDPTKWQNKKTTKVLGILFVNNIADTQQDSDTIMYMCNGIDEVFVVNRNDNEIKTLLAALLNDERYTHVMFFTQKRLPNYHYNISNALEVLERTHGHAVYFDRYQRSQELCPYIVEIQLAVYAWKFRWASDSLQKRYSCHNTLYKRETLVKALGQIDGNSLRSIKKTWNLLPHKSQEDIGLLLSPIYN
jgi:hypothetical protein